MSTASTLTVTPISALDDNYIWVISIPNSSLVYVVDPGDASVVIQYLQVHKLTLAGILLTHHHHDHTGGVSALIDHSSVPIEVFGPSNENIANISNPITKQTHVNLQALGLTATIIYLPGHTLGHIAYHIQDVLFCGDTLFSGGCGRLFEGNASQLYHSLQSLANLPGNTRVYCAHEYTLSNLKFAMMVDPDNAALINYDKHCQTLRANHQATLPSNIKTEREINPFLRCHTPDVINSVNLHFNQEAKDTVTTLGLLRQWKDKA